MVAQPTGGFLFLAQRSRNQRSSPASFHLPLSLLTASLNLPTSTLAERFARQTQAPNGPSSRMAIPHTPGHHHTPENQHRTHLAGQNRKPNNPTANRITNTFLRTKLLRTKWPNKRHMQRALPQYLFNLVLCLGWGGSNHSLLLPIMLLLYYMSILLQSTGA